MMSIGKEQDPSTVLGTREHAQAMTEGRHPGVRDALQWLTFAHLPEALRKYSQPFYETAVILLIQIPLDSPEFTTTLNKLIEAKDAAMRAGIKASTGQAGSVPRPQEVVQPPLIDNRIGPNFGRAKVDPPYLIGGEVSGGNYGPGQPADRPIHKYDDPEA